MDLRPALAAAVLALVAPACIATVPHAEPEVLAAARPMFPDYQAEELEQDRELLLAHCTGCHQLAPGPRLEVEEWPRVIREMRKEVMYDDATAERLLRYLQTSRLFWEAERERLREQRRQRREAAANRLRPG